MDRFFVAYDYACKKEGFKVDWFFSNSIPHQFYNDLSVLSSANVSGEKLFIEYSKNKILNYSVVITHFVQLCTPFFAETKRIHSEVSIIAVDHNPRPINGFPLKKRIRNRINSVLYGKHIDVFVGVSQYTVNHILKDFGYHLKNKVKLIYNGVDTTIYSKRTDENLGKMVVASHLRASKGIQDLIEAVYLLPLSVREVVHIDIFGEGPMENELKEKVELYSLRDHINFKGSSSNLPILLQKYSYMLQPTYMECFSLSILESLAANVPVITTPVGGNAEIIKDKENGFLFSPGNIKELSLLLIEIINQDQGIKNNVMKKVEENYTLEIMVDNHLKVLQCI